jgi:hypothetical protein
MVEEITPQFNSGTATLMRIDEILRSIHTIKMDIKTSWIIKYTLVYRAIEDLLNVSAPLIGREIYDKLSGELYELPLRAYEKASGEGENEEFRKYLIKMNQIISGVQFKLQELGFLMPDKKGNHFPKTE